jgi:hypothetical protein
VGVRGSGICSQSASGIDESNEGGGGGRVCEEKGGRGGLTVSFHTFNPSLFQLPNDRMYQRTHISRLRIDPFLELETTDQKSLVTLRN